MPSVSNRAKLRRENKGGKAIGGYSQVRRKIRKNPARESTICAIFIFEVPPSLRSLDNTQYLLIMEQTACCALPVECARNIEYVKGPRAGPGPLGPRAPGILTPLPPPLDGPGFDNQIILRKSKGTPGTASIIQRTPRVMLLLSTRIKNNNRYKSKKRTLRSEQLNAQIGSLVPENKKIIPKKNNKKKNNSKKFSPTVWGCQYRQRISMYRISIFLKSIRLFRYLFEYSGTYSNVEVEGHIGMYGTHTLLKWKPERMYLGERWW
ncbi:unnamed protein product [Nesidiocoris tenuis]|uniref:Uncharacterized protein n=1 Tax=Nesidiocoris tenuis TaxID=355587 RepID=A0A6H5HQ32_9HEMI|nr:unnamed protein product [Nesidiocoris tenuis]